MVTELPSLFQQTYWEITCKNDNNSKEIGIVVLLTVNTKRKVEMHFDSFLFYSIAFLAFLTPARSLPFHS